MASVRVWPDTVLLLVGDEVQFSATALDSRFHALRDRPMRWNSADMTVSTTSRSGMVRGLNIGATEITASFEGRTGRAAVKVVGPEDLPSLGREVQPVLTAKCATAGCHVEPAPPLGLSLRRGQTFSTTVNVPSVELPALLRVAPFDPLASWLLLEVERRAHDELMDRAFRAHADVTLSAPEVAMIRSWIQAGAKDN